MAICRYLSECPEIVFESSSNCLYIRSMKPWGRFIFVFIAYSMILLHTAVPHQHAGSADGKTTISAPGCVYANSMRGFLQMVFSTDLGYGHLETFQKSTDTDIDFSGAILPFIAVFIPLILMKGILHEKRAFSEIHIEKLCKRLLLFSSTQFRAPPIA